MCQVSLGLKVVQIGAHDFKYNKVPLFARKSREYQYFNICCPETSSCASKPLLLRCKFVISHSINTSMSAAPKVAVVPATRYYCDVNWPYHNVCAKFH